MNKEKHIFAGNNSSKGFFSYFDHIISLEAAERIYILKGGPGVGKSSFMKKFGKEMAAKGYDLEYIHCSSDNDSLDGLLIPQLKILFVDGTAPHIVDPRVPGAVDEIINLGVYLNSKELEKHKLKIMQINKTISCLYNSAFRYLSAANSIKEEINSIYDKITDEDKFRQISDETISKLFDSVPTIKKRGKNRKVFSEAYTSSGYIDYINTLVQDLNVYAIVGENHNYVSKLLKIVADESIKRGYDIQCSYYALNPEKIQHIIIPELNIAIITAENCMGVNCKVAVNLHNIMDTDKLKSYISEIENNMHLYDLLIKNALGKLSDTKKHHDLLEVFYLNSMDFSKVDSCFEKLLSEY